MTLRVESRETPSLEAYCDVDFASDKKKRKSLTGRVVLLNGMPVSWSAKKEGSVSSSTMEAEFFAASEASRDLLGVLEMLGEMNKVAALLMLIHSNTRRTSINSKARHHRSRLHTLMCGSSSYATTPDAASFSRNTYGADARRLADESTGPRKACKFACTRVLE